MFFKIQKTVKSCSIFVTPQPTMSLSGLIRKTSTCLIFLNFLEKKKKGAKCNNFQRNLKKNFKEILVLKILRLLIALKHSFKSFKGQKALFKPFDIFLMQKCSYTHPVLSNWIAFNPPMSWLESHRLAFNGHLCAPLP